MTTQGLKPNWATTQAGPPQAPIARSANGKAAPQKRERLKPIAWSAIHCLPRREFLVGGLLDSTAMSVVFGGSNTGKTFFCLDLAARIALGWEWRGRKVKPGTVVYIAAEGGLGIEERLTAFRVHHHVEAEGVPFWIIPEPIDLCRADGDLKLLLQRISELPQRPQLIIVDTLSRAMAGGNENSPDDMGRFVKHCDEIRIRTGAHVMVIHHAGKDDSRGARGHSLLRAAADTEIEVARSEATGACAATVVKQRDHPTGAAFGFRLESVDIGQDDDGETITSCVILEAEGASPGGSPRQMPKGAQIAMRALQEALQERGEPAPASNHIPFNVRVVSVASWREYTYRRGISTSEEPRARQQAFKRASEHLIAARMVGIWGDMAWVTG